VPQFIPEQVLVVVQFGVEAQRSERAAALREETPHTAVEQFADQVVVQRPTRVMVARDGDANQADIGVDDHSDNGKGCPRYGARDEEADLRKSKKFAPRGPELLEVVWAPSPCGKDLLRCGKRAGGIRYLLAPDARSRSITEIGAQCLAPTPSKIRAMVAGKQQHPAA
jgi:hypothetical protein